MDGAQIMHLAKILEGPKRYVFQANRDPTSENGSPITNEKLLESPRD
jgi:hypothetical protein